MGLFDFLKGEKKEKEEFNKGDIFYGVSQKRGETVIKLANTEQSNDSIVANPLTIDRLNIVSGVTNFIQYGKPLTPIGSVDNIEKTDNAEESVSDDVFMNYSNFNKYLADNNFNDKSDNISERWLAFLKDNLEYLSFDKNIESLDTNQSNNLKDRLYKNSTDEFLKYPKFSKELREQIIASYNNNQAIADMNPDIEEACQEWMNNSFFRKTSKLGIDFFIKEKKNIHFVLDVPEKEIKSYFKNKNSMDDYADLENSKTKFLPLTASELRYINRKHGFDHPQIDFFKFSNSTLKPIRNNEMGYLKEYLNRREANKAKSYNEFLKPSATKLTTEKNDVKPKIEDRPVSKKTAKGIR